MMLLPKEKVLLLVKLFGFIFLSFMFITSLIQMNIMTKENELKAKNTWYNNSNYSKQCGSSPFSFFVYAFILGAFWNVKKIQKLGLL